MRKAGAVAGASGQQCLLQPFLLIFAPFSSLGLWEWVSSVSIVGSLGEAEEEFLRL